jgi:RNA polymerase sigma factor (sigma-70 family)
MDRAHGADFVLSDYAKSVIRFKARQLSRRQGFTSSDLDDLQQELWLTLIKKAEQFDPAKASLDTFIDRVVNMATAMILRARRRLNRSRGFQQSLNVDVAAAGKSPEPASAAICENDLARRTGVERRDEIERAEEAEAINQALDQMPEELRDICRRLMGGTIAAVARDLKRIGPNGVEGIGKSTFGAQAPKPIFIQTEDGLDEIACERFPLAKTYDDVVGALAELRIEKHDYETVVIDSLDWLERMIWDKVCQDTGTKNIEKADGGYARGYMHALTYWREIVDQLNQLRSGHGMVVLLIAHAKVEKFEDPESSP